MIQRHRIFACLFWLFSLSYAQLVPVQVALAASPHANSAPAPLAKPGHPVDWLFIFKFNAATFPGCSENRGSPIGSPGIFGGTVQNYHSQSQQYVYATSEQPTLTAGTGCLGATTTDPLGATFAQVYDSPGVNYVLWNDQFYGNPIANEDAPVGHSKGMVAWNEDGEGFVLQVSTPSWPASGSKGHPRQHDGNTLGCIKDDDIEVCQHFFALRLTKDDLVQVLSGLANASVATSVQHPEIVNNGGPEDVQTLVNSLGKRSNSTDCMMVELSSGVRFISKPSAMTAPPWQVVSAKLEGLPLRVASWWARPLIYSTSGDETIDSWPTELGKPGPVEIAISGLWKHEVIGLTGGGGPNHNHAKLGISKNRSKPICIFGDENQQGALCANYAYHGQKMSSSQNGRGGTFYVLKNQQLFESLTELLSGASAPNSGPNGEK